jgi:hypothetical protein
MKILYKLICRICALTLVLFCLEGQLAYAAREPVNLALIGLSATAGPRAGLGVTTGIARAECGELGCGGYGLVLNNRLGRYYTASLEAGVGMFMMVVPGYAGLGVRARDGKVVGGQASVGTGVGPVMALLTIFTEDSKVLAEIGLSATLPIPIGERKG